MAKSRANPHVVDVIVTLDRSPLAGATVRMVPDFDPGDGSQAKSAQTDAKGTAHFEVALEDLTKALHNPDYRGVFGSNYKIEITHPQREVPAKYNVNSRLTSDLPREPSRSELTFEL